MHSWLHELRVLARDRVPVVLLTVLSVRGSAPREVGAKMLVTTAESIGTIGGGQLEYQCTQLAVEQLRNQDALDQPTQTRRFALGANCGQCCGGVVEVMFETLMSASVDWLCLLLQHYERRQPLAVATASKGSTHKILITADECYNFPVTRHCPPDVLLEARSMLESSGSAHACGEYFLEALDDRRTEIVIFGAGHVGAAVVDVVSRLDCHIRWIDSRRNIFPQTVPANVTTIECAAPAGEVAAVAGGACYLIMTHSHALDQEICQAVLARRDFAYCGLIGSVSKRRRFVRRMQGQGMAMSLLERLVCPIGVTGIAGKKPVEIAVAVGAELLQVRDARNCTQKSVPVCREVTAG